MCIYIYIYVHIYIYICIYIYAYIYIHINIGKIEAGKQWKAAETTRNHWKTRDLMVKTCKNPWSPSNFLTDPLRILKGFHDENCAFNICLSKIGILS